MKLTLQLTGLGLALALTSANAFAITCGEATQNLMAAQQAWNEASSAYNNVDSICHGNPACNKAVYDNTVRAANELRRAGDEYNQACH